MKKDARLIYMTMGDRDELCLVHLLFDYLKDSTGNISVSVAGGDHGFRIKKPNGSLDQVRSDRNIETVVKSLFNWADLKLTN